MLNGDIFAALDSIFIWKWATYFQTLGQINLDFLGNLFSNKCAIFFTKVGGVFENSVNWGWKGTSSKIDMAQFFNILWFNISELIQQSLGPFESKICSFLGRAFMRSLENSSFNKVLEKIDTKSLSVPKGSFLQDSIICKLLQGLNKELFQQNFWYSVCRLINRNIKIRVFMYLYVSSTRC